MIVCEMMVQIVAVVGGTPINKQLNPVASLLQFMPADISAEIAYNGREATMAPHCSVCSLFVAVNDHCLLGLERYWHWVIGYWAIFADIG